MPGIDAFMSQVPVDQLARQLGVDEQPAAKTAKAASAVLLDGMEANASRSAAATGKGHRPARRKWGRPPPAPHPPSGQVAPSARRRSFAKSASQPARSSGSRSSNRQAIKVHGTGQ